MLNLDAILSAGRDNIGRTYGDLQNFSSLANYLREFLRISETDQIINCSTHFFMRLLHTAILAQGLLPRWQPGDRKVVDRSTWFRLLFFVACYDRMKV